MNKTEHLIIGVVVGVILILLTHYFLHWFDLSGFNFLILIFIIYIYSLLADIDHKNSTITWTFLFIAGIGIIYGMIIENNLYTLISVGLLVVTLLIAQFLPHRGFTHSILFGLLVSLPWIYLSYEYALLAFLCYYSHLAADEEWFKFY